MNKKLTAADEERLRVMARRLIPSIKAFYEDPENRRAYEEWAAQEEQKEKTKGEKQ